MNTILKNINDFHKSGKKSDFQKKLYSLQTNLTLLFFSFSLARPKIKAESPNIYLLSEDKINTNSDMCEV
jgi:hypothetical protein